MSEAEAVRLDIWLWRARFFKTRSHSAKACESGHIRMERFGKMSRVEKASTAIKPDDRLIFALGERRGPAPEAQSLYRQAPQTPDIKPKA